MKQGKLLILLAAILSFSMMAVGCQDDGGVYVPSTGTDAATEADTAAVTENETTAGAETTAPETQEPETEPARVEHELHDWFILDEEDEAKNFVNLTRLEGEVVGTDYYNNLIVIRDRDLDRYNNVITKVSVCNVLTGETLVKAEASSPYGAEDEDAVQLDVEIEYPIIRVMKSYYNEKDEAVYDADYYLAKSGDDACIYSVKEVNAELAPANFYVDYWYNGLVKCTMGDRVVWIDRDMNVIRSVAAIVANGYSEYFQGEYQGCLYTLEREYVRVFNREGFCSAEYSCEDREDAELISVILDNGNVLVQEIEEVDEYTICDYVIDGERYTVKSFLLDFDNGNLTELDLDFVVVDLATAYAQERGDSPFPFELADGKENQAMIHHFANGSISAYPEYVVMNNDLVVEYTLKNDTLGVDLSTAYPLDYAHYSAWVDSGVASGTYVFDLDGNIVSYDADGYMIEGYLVVDGGCIYDLEGNMIFDAKAEGYTLHSTVYNDSVIYLKKFNYVTGGTEYYVLNSVRGKKPALLADGVSVCLADPTDRVAMKVAERSHLADDYYILFNVESKEYTVYAIDGTEMLVTMVAPTVSVRDDIFVISTSFDGESLVYIAKESASPAIQPETETETETETAAEEATSDAN